MLTRRGQFFAALFALAAWPCAALARRARPAAQPKPSPTPTEPAQAIHLLWKMVVDRATYDAVLNPPVLPAAPGRIEVHYEWQENDKVEQWWEQVIAGGNDPKSVILYVKNGPSPKAKTLIGYSLDGVHLAAFHGPALSRDGGYTGPSTAVLTYQAVRVLPH